MFKDLQLMEENSDFFVVTFKYPPFDVKYEGDKKI